MKANISTIVGAIYEFDDPRRDSGFSLFYMGINLGSLLSSLSCGIIGILWGWKYGFGLADIYEIVEGMAGLEGIGEGWIKRGLPTDQFLPPDR